MDAFESAVARRASPLRVDVRLESERELATGGRLSFSVASADVESVSAEPS